MSEFESFQDVLATLRKPAKVETTFTIALGDYFEGSTAVLTFNKLKASLFYSDELKEIYDVLVFNRCKEDMPTMLYIAMVVASHVEPPSSSQGGLILGYMNIFAAMDEVQKLRFVQEFEEKSGGDLLANAVKAIADKKKGLETEKPEKTASNGSSSGTVSATSNVTRPKRPSRSKTSRTLSRTTN